jgi:hypothetical protein
MFVTKHFSECSKHQVMGIIKPKRPHLHARVAKLRLDWALAHQNWTLEDWRHIIWSDECSVEIGKCKRHKWVFHLNFHNEKWKKEYVDTYVPLRSAASRSCKDITHINLLGTKWMRGGYYYSELLPIIAINGPHSHKPS